MKVLLFITILLCVQGALGTPVFVRAYWRWRRGRKELVRAHWRYRR